MAEYAVQTATPDPGRVELVERYWESLTDVIAERKTAMVRAAKAGGARMDANEKRSLARLEKDAGAVRKLLDGWEKSGARQRPSATGRPITTPGRRGAAYTPEWSTA